MWWAAAPEKGSCCMLDEVLTLEREIGEGLEELLNEVDA
jgi:hypothetical protein